MDTQKRKKKSEGSKEKKGYRKTSTGDAFMGEKERDKMKEKKRHKEREGSGELKVPKMGRSISVPNKASPTADLRQSPTLILSESDRSFVRRLSGEKDRHNRPHLHLAIESDRLAVVRYLALFPERPIWHITDRNGWSPLHVACHLGNIPIIDFLLTNTDPHPVDTVSIDRSTPLHYFVRHPLPPPSVCGKEKYFAILERLLGPSEPALGSPPTSDASHFGYRNVNAPNKYGDTPLHVAVSKAVSSDIILFLLSHDASVNASNA